MSRKCCLILACSKEKYERIRFENWVLCISELAEKMPIFYLFGKSNRESNIPSHPNVYKIQANCNDNYEDIALKMYDGFRFLSMFDFDYIIKLDENITLTTISLFCQIIEEEVKSNDYLALKAVACNGINANTVFFSFWHSDVSYDKRLATMPQIIVGGIRYAGGPGYVLTKRAYLPLKMRDFLQIYEDYCVGYALSKRNILPKESKVSKSILQDNCQSKEYTQLEFGIHDPTIITNLLSKTLSIPDIPTCIAKISGGLGNQMFQIATAMSYCFKNNMQLSLSPEINNSRNYYWDSLLSPFKSRLTTDSYSEIYSEKSFAYNEIPSYDHNIEIHGYFQSSKYFINNSDVWKHMLIFQDNTRARILEKYGDILTNQHVIVHARRGDYLQKSLYHENLDESYYESAKNHMKNKLLTPKFILISDDENFWKSSAIFQNEDAIIFNESEIDTLWLMIHSKHFIMANSSFSWWGAYLSKSTNVIVPRKWFGPSGPTDWNDIYEKDWLRI